VAWRGQGEGGVGLGGLHSSLFFSFLPHRPGQLEQAGSPRGAALTRKLDAYNSTGDVPAPTSRHPLGPAAPPAWLSLAAPGREVTTHPFKHSTNPDC